MQAASSPGTPPITPSETAALLHSFDWSRTPLGRLPHWPQALRIAVGICLNSRFPMFVWWGPELINIYNDAYALVLGKRHPWAFGRSAPLVWDDIWHIVGPQAEAVMQRGAATWNERVLLVMARNGYTEDTYFTWSYSAIPDDSGGIGGVFCACTEETGHVAAERERDRLLEEVQTERARLAEAFEQSPSFLAILHGPDHVFQFVNERYYQLIGRRDILGKRVQEVLPELTGQGFYELLHRVYATGEPYVGSGMRLMLQRQAGRPLQESFVDFVYQPVRGADATVVGVLAHGVDVTERQHAEARDRFLLLLEGTVRTLSDPLEITAASARLLGQYLEADRCAYADVEDDQDTFNLTGDYNRDVPSIVGRYRFADFGAEVLQLMREGSPYVVEDVDTHLPPIGDLTFYRQTLIQAVICVPLHKAGRFVAAMAVHQRVPRTWTRAEVELVLHVANRCWESIERARVERTLRDSEARFRQLADAMPQIVFTASPEGEVDYFNRQWYEYTGLPPGSTSFESWKAVHTEEGLARVNEAWPHALRTGERYEIEYPLRRHDGLYRWHLGRALPIRDGKGRVVRWFGTNTDIHDRKQIEDALSQALEAEQSARSAAERASRMKDEFLATLSHELRTPLNAILGWSQILRVKAPLSPDLARGIETIERNARAQAQIIEDLLDMSAIISGKIRLDLARVQLADLVQAAVEAARPAADARRVAVVTHVGRARDSELSADAGRIQQVLWNLINNAIKFTGEGGSVEVVLERSAAELTIRVSDTGEGIDPDFLPFVFDRFRQADATITRRYGGLGLGLSIVKQLVELHGGSVRADSPGRGRGSTFVVSLPRGGAESAAELAPAAALRANAIRASVDGCHAIAGLKVLVVDDDADARELVRRLLADCKVQVITAGDAEEALSALKREQLDVLVSDIGMPGSDGYELIQRVRSLASENAAAIPALALTAYARPEDRVKALRAGFQMHLAKPVDPGELIAIVASLARRV